CKRFCCGPIAPSSCNGLPGMVHKNPLCVASSTPPELGAMNFGRPHPTRAAARAKMLKRDARTKRANVVSDPAHGKLGLQPRRPAAAHGGRVVIVSYPSSL